MKENATPRPWVRGRGADAQYIIAVGDGSQPTRRVAEVYYGRIEVDERNANAELIVRAVNSHEALVEALEMGNDTEDGPALLRRVASMVFRVAGPVTATELRRKADAEEAALAKAKEA
jgi:hypothetical protein